MLPRAAMVYLQKGCSWWLTPGKEAALLKVNLAYPVSSVILIAERKKSCPLFSQLIIYTAYVFGTKVCQHESTALAAESGGADSSTPQSDAQQE